MTKFNFQNNLIRERSKRGISQRELGKMIGLSNGTISKIENGTRTPDLPLVEKIASALGVSLEELLF